MAGKFTGADAALKDLERIQAGARNEFARALGETLATKVPAVRALVPTDKGDLRDTVRMEGPEVKGAVVSAAIAAGGDGVDYALYVHEDLEAQHDDGQAKFIETVLKEGTGTLPRDFGGKVNLDKLLR